MTEPHAKSITYRQRVKSSPNNPGRGGPGHGCMTVLALPSGVPVVELLTRISKDEEQLGGFLMVASALWEGRNRHARTIRLPKAISLRFVTLRGGNPVTEVCKALGCELLEKGTNYNGRITNVWSYPPGYDGNTVEVSVWLRRHQARRWKARAVIMQACQEKAQPTVRAVRAVLRRISESEDFKQQADGLTARGEIQAVAAWRNNPMKLTVTREGDILTAVARLPKRLRQSLLLDGRPVVELDIKSAHAVLLGGFYHVGTTHAAEMEERSRFVLEANAGFPSLYGEKKQHKTKFLAALNQSERIARHASVGFRELEARFPILARRLAQIRQNRAGAVGAILRSKLSCIMNGVINQYHATGVPCLPITDSILLPADCDAEACARRISEAVAAFTSITPIICNSMKGMQK